MDTLPLSDFFNYTQALGPLVENLLLEGKQFYKKELEFLATLLHAAIRPADEHFVFPTEAMYTLRCESRKKDSALNPEAVGKIKQLQDMYKSRCESDSGWDSMQKGSHKLVAGLIELYEGGDLFAKAQPLFTAVNEELGRSVSVKEDGN